ADRADDLILHSKLQQRMVLGMDRVEVVRQTFSPRFCLRCEFLPRLIEGNAVSKFADDGESMVSSALPVSRRKLQRHPDVAHVDLTRRVLKSTRHHSDDRGAHSVQFGFAAGNVGSSSKGAPPQAIRYENRQGSALFVVVRADPTAKLRSN